MYSVKNKVFKVIKTTLFILVILMNFYVLAFFLVFNRANIFPCLVAKPYIYAGPPGISVLYPVGNERSAKFIFSIYAPMRKYLESNRIAVFIVSGKAGGSNENKH